MNKLKYIGLIALGALALGCGNDFLDISPKGNLGEHEAIENQQDMQYGLNGAYLKLSYYEGTSLWDGDAKGDDMMCGPSQSTMGYAYFYDRTASNAPTGRWKGLYYSCAHINAVLEKAKNVQKVDDNYERILAELRFIRVILHWDAELRYGPLPTALKAPGTRIKPDALGVMIADFLPEDVRATFYRDKVTEVWDFMISEMETLVKDLSKTPTDGYLNYWAGQLFLSRLYLYTEQWEKALACVKDVIDNSPFRLYERNEYVEAWAKAFTKEAIFEIPTTTSSNMGWNSLAYHSDPDGYASVVATADFVELMKKDPTDVRFDLFVKRNVDHRDWYYAQLKYPGRDGNIWLNNPKVFRLSEAYLIAAEAALRSGDPDLGGKYLSDLREKRSLQEPRKYDGGNITLDDVLYERRVELWGEGHRAWDLFRNLRPVVRFRTVEEKEAKGHWCNNDAGLIEYDDYRVIWPMSQAEMGLLTPADRLTQQNPGY